MDSICLWWISLQLLAILASDVITSKPVSEMCIAFESSYHIDRGCECFVYESYGRSQGTFHSVSYPAIYPSNLSCALYTFIGDLDEIVELNFVEFDIQRPSADRKCSDFVRLYLNLERPEVNGHPTYELCGDLTSSSLGVVQRNFFSSKRSLIVEMHTDGKHTNNTGFMGVFKFIEKAQFDTVGGTRRWDTLCSYDFYSSKLSKSGNFFSPNYPQNYPSNSSCRYIFYGGPEERVRITLLSIQLEGARDGGCSTRGDIITIRDGVDSTSPIILYHCGSAKSPLNITSTGENISVDFISNERTELQGFAANFQFIHRRHLPWSTTTSAMTKPTEKIARTTVALHPTDEMRFKHHEGNSLRDSPMVSHNVENALSTSEKKEGCYLELTSREKKSGAITSPRYPHPYPSDTICRYVFYGQGREHVQLIFNVLDLNDPQHGNSRTPTNECEEADSVTVSVYIDNVLSEIAVFCAGSRKPQVLLSPDHRMEVVFVSRVTSSLSTAIGFEANFLFTLDYGIKTGDQDINKDCSFAYRSNKSQNGTFTSPNYPGLYPRNTECHYLFYGHEGERIQITFLYFDVDGIPSGCLEQTDSDYVEFSNFNVLLTDRKMMRWCGTKIDGAIKSTSVSSDTNFFRVTFRSNHVFDATGFQALYQFQPSEEPMPTGPRQLPSLSASSVPVHYSASLHIYGILLQLLISQKLVNFQILCAFQLALLFLVHLYS